MKNFGIKLWSKDIIKNFDFAKESIEAVKKGYFDYIELFALPDSYADTCNEWKNLIGDLNVIIHSPHNLFGVDTGNKDELNNNLRKLKSSQEFADLFDSEIIILHTGMKSETKYLEESIRQFNIINDKRIAVENMPCYCSVLKNLLHGTTPEEIKYFISETKSKFCLDFSHAICANLNLKRLQQLKIMSTHCAASAKN